MKQSFNLQLAQKLVDSPKCQLSAHMQREALEEITRLRHDLERYMDIANEHVNEAERLRRALTHIAFSGEDGPYGEFGEALNEHQMRSLAQVTLVATKIRAHLRQHDAADDIRNPQEPT